MQLGRLTAKAGTAVPFWVHSAGLYTRRDISRLGVSLESVEEAVRDLGRLIEDVRDKVDAYY